MAKQSLSSGEIAKYCEVTHRTITRWINDGHLIAYKLPGRGNNRIKVDDFIKFLRSNNMPIPEEFQVAAPKVLIVEDDKAMAKTIERTLNKNGFETQIVTNSIRTGANVVSFEPDVITLDIGMPGLDGFEIIDFLREGDQYKHIKILIISGATADKMEEAVTAGADDTLEKPYDNKILLEKICNLTAVELKIRKQLRKKS